MPVDNVVRNSLGKRACNGGESRRVRAWERPGASDALKSKRRYSWRARLNAPLENRSENKAKPVAESN